jgi:hypothetical protein
VALAVLGADTLFGEELHTGVKEVGQEVQEEAISGVLKGFPDPFVSRVSQGIMTVQPAATSVMVRI